MDNQKQPPGELLTCEVCSQQPESIAFDPDECCEECPFRKGAIPDGAYCTVSCLRAAPSSIQNVPSEVPLISR